MILMERHQVFLLLLPRTLALILPLTLIQVLLAVNLLQQQGHPQVQEEMEVIVVIVT